MGKPAASLLWTSAFAEFTSTFLFKPSVFLNSGDLAVLASVGFSGGGGGGVWGRTHRPTGGRRAKNKKKIIAFNNCKKKRKFLGLLGFLHKLVRSHIHSSYNRQTQSAQTNTTQKWCVFVFLTHISIWDNSFQNSYCSATISGCLVWIDLLRSH